MTMNSTKTIDRMKDLLEQARSEIDYLIGENTKLKEELAQYKNENGQTEEEQSSSNETIFVDFVNRERL